MQHLPSVLSRGPGYLLKASAKNDTGKAQQASRTGGDALALHKREGVHDGRAHALMFLITAPSLTTTVLSGVTPAAAVIRALKKLKILNNMHFS
jgi:hypothetical protein